jgi:hypothetical protein
MTAQQMKDEPGFDKDHWPAMADEKWGTEIHRYYNRDPYWGRRVGDVSDTL